MGEIEGEYIFSGGGGKAKTKGITTFHYYKLRLLKKNAKVKGMATYHFKLRLLKKRAGNISLQIEVVE